MTILRVTLESELSMEDCESSQSGLSTRLRHDMFPVLINVRLGWTNGANRCGPFNTQCAKWILGQIAQRWLPVWAPAFAFKEPQRVKFVTDVHKRNRKSERSRSCNGLTATLASTSISNSADSVTCQWHSHGPFQVHTSHQPSPFLCIN